MSNRTSKATSRRGAREKPGAATGNAVSDIATRITETLVRSAAAKSAATDKPKRKPKASTRVGKRGLVIFVEPAMGDALRLLAKRSQKHLQTLAVDALSALLAEHGLATVEQPAAAAKTV